MTNGGALTGPADHRHNTATLDRITGISAVRVHSLGQPGLGPFPAARGTDHPVALAPPSLEHHSGRVRHDARWHSSGRGGGLGRVYRRGTSGGRSAVGGMTDFGGARDSPLLR